MYIRHKYNNKKLFMNDKRSYKSNTIKIYVACNSPRTDKVT